MTDDSSSADIFAYDSALVEVRARTIAAHIISGNAPEALYLEDLTISGSPGYAAMVAACASQLVTQYCLDPTTTHAIAVIVTKRLCGFQGAALSELHTWDRRCNLGW